MTKVLLTLAVSEFVFRFGVDTAAYQSLRRSAEYRWPAQERAGRAPARQFTGPGNEAIELEGVIYPAEHGGGKQVADLRFMANLGLPMTLTAGTGEVLGQWVVERVDETQTLFLADGTPRRQEFRVGLAAYG